MAQKRYDNQERQNLKPFLDDYGKYRTPKYYIEQLAVLIDIAKTELDEGQPGTHDRTTPMLQLFLMRDIAYYLYFNTDTPTGQHRHDIANQKQLTVLTDLVNTATGVLNDYFNQKEFEVDFLGVTQLNQALIELWDYALSSETTIYELMQGLARLGYISQTHTHFLVEDIYNRLELDEALRKQTLRQITDQCDLLATDFTTSRNTIFRHYKEINAYNILVDIMADVYGVEALKIRKIDLKAITHDLLQLNDDVQAVIDNVNMIDAHIYLDEGVILDEDTRNLQGTITRKLEKIIIKSNSKLLRPTNRQIDFAVEGVKAYRTFSITKTKVMNLYAVLIMEGKAFNEKI